MRWVTQGVWIEQVGCKVKLESFLEGRRRYVTIEAIDEFNRHVNS